ncbi:hypothetical protein OIU76_012173 [Salix suchowensis]|nr:hypothetical protein OIU76_012173 [Salix suchowensis]
MTKIIKDPMLNYIVRVCKGISSLITKITNCWG